MTPYSFEQDLYTQHIRKGDAIKDLSLIKLLIKKQDIHI